MKCLLSLILIMGVIPHNFAQDDAPDMIWETIILVPDNTKLKTLEENMRAHNIKYHARGTTHQAMVYTISTGPNVNKLIWSMGPTTFTNLDTRPAAGGHDEDWRDNVMPYIKKMERAEYWSAMTELNNTDMLEGDEMKFKHMYIRYHEVAEGQGFNLKTLLKQMSDGVKAMEGENPFGFYDNSFRQGYDNGRHIATISFLKNWAELDEDWELKKGFVKAHGDDAWEPWTEGMSAAMRNSWDEIWSYNKKMSGH